MCDSTIIQTYNKEKNIMHVSILDAEVMAKLRILHISPLSVTATLFLILSSFIMFLTCNLINVPIFVPFLNTVPLDPKSLSYKSFIFVPNFFILFLLFLREDRHKKAFFLVVGPLTV